MIILVLIRLVSESVIGKGFYPNSLVDQEKTTGRTHRSVLDMNRRQDINEIIAATFPLGEYSVYVEGGAKSNDPINLSNEGTVCAKKETIGLLVNKMNIM